MSKTRSVRSSWISRLPWVGAYVKRNVDKALLKQLETIEARFSSPSVRFDELLRDLYDCLEALERPLEINPAAFHGHTLAIHTRSSNSVASYLDRIHANENLPQDDFFKLYGNRGVKEFLDWYSNDETLERFIKYTMGMMGVFLNQFKQEGDREIEEVPTMNDALDRLVYSRWLKMMVLDLIQVVITVLRQRTGG